MKSIFVGLLLSILLCGCVVTGSKTTATPTSTTTTSVSASGLSMMEGIIQLPGTITATAVTLKQLAGETPATTATATNVSNWASWAKVAATAAGIPTPIVVTDAEKAVSAVLTTTGK